MKILIVDDDAINLKMAEFALKKEHEVIKTSSGKGALLTVKMNRPDLILLDILMPEMDGFQTLEALSGISGASDIPVVFLSASCDEETIERVRNTRALGLIQKPFVPAMLLSQVEEFYSKWKEK